MTLAVVLSLAIFLILLGLFFDRRTRALTAAGDVLDLFYQSAEALVDDDRTPIIIVEQISTISKRLNEKFLLLRFVVFALSGRIKDVRENKKVKELDAAISELPDELLGHYFRALTAGLFIVTFQSAFLGPVFRRLILFGIEVSDRSREQEKNVQSEKIAIGVFRPSNCDDHHHDDGAMPAAA